MFVKKSTYKYYTNLDTLPIWNWYKLHNEKHLELKYLLLLNNYDQEIKVSQKISYQLKNKYKELVYSFDSINSTLFEAKKNLISQLIEMFLKIFAESNNIEKLEKAQIILNALIVAENPNMDWLFNVDFTETNDQKRFLTELGIAIERYNKKLKISDSKEIQTLSEKKAKIESILGVTIETKKCSVFDFVAYEKEAINKVNNGKG